MRKKAIENLKSFTIMFLVVVLFILALVKLPDIVMEKEIYDSFNSDNVRVKDFGKSDNFIEETKFITIADSIIDDFNTIKINDVMGVKYVVELTLDSKISNRENTIAQEVMSLYLRNYTDEAKNLTKFFVEHRLDSFDDKEDWTWRNYEMYMIFDDISVVLYSKKSLLVDVYDANIVGLSSSIVKPFSMQIYNFSYINGSYDIVSVDLISGEEFGNLSNFIDTENSNKLKSGIDSLDVYFEEMDKIYEFKFIVWR